MGTQYIFNCPCCNTPLGNPEKLWICKEGHTFKEIDFDGNVNAGPLFTVELVSKHSCCKIGTQFSILGESV
jgi:hypothetical protein